MSTDTPNTQSPDAPVLTSIDARGIATITLNRPAVNNAYDGAMIDGLLKAGPALAGDAAVRAIVIRGNGRHFQAGADLQWIRSIPRGDDAANLAVSRATALALRQLDGAGKPTIALVQGACIGGGTGIIASCDIVVAERTASFAISEARWGLTAAVIFPQLNAAIGVRQVRRYALSCERFDATRAQAIGLVHELCEPGMLDAAAAPIIDSLLTAAPDSIARTKLGAMRCAGTLIDDADFERLVAEHAAKRQSDEALEGLASFDEKRAPRWYAPAQRRP
ncbi:MAG: enoyl-CoA hydratase-related protein [Lautropia sp.]